MKAKPQVSYLDFCCVVAACVMLSVGFVASQDKHPFQGIWHANIAKSKRHPNHLFKSATMRFEVAAGVVSLTYTGVNMSGVEESGTTRLNPDGEEHPIPEAPGFITVSRWLSPRILETVATKDGKVVGHSTYEASDDGKTLTATIRGTDAGGAEFEQTIIFERE